MGSAREGQLHGHGGGTSLAQGMRPHVWFSLSGHGPTFSQGTLEKQVGVTFVISPHTFQSMRK